jgi:hemolysin D
MVTYRSDPQRRIPSVVPDPHVNQFSPGVEWSGAIQSVLDEPASSLPLKLTLIGLGFMTACGTWAYLGQIDEVAKASGKLVPQGEVFKVSAIEAGKIERLRIVEGQTVQAGEALAELDTEVTRKEIERLQNQLVSIQTESQQTAGMVARTHLEAEARATLAEQTVQAQEVTVRQNAATAETNQALLEQLQQDARAKTERVERLRPLTEVGALSREQVFEMEASVRDRQRSITESQGSLKRAQGDTDRLQVEMAQKRTEAQQARLTAQQQVQELQIKQTALQGKLQETQSLIEATQAKLKHRQINAPIGGVISTLNVHNAGEAVQPGQPIAEIIPEGKPLILSVAMPSQSAGFIRLGMAAKVKLDAYAYQDYGVIQGKVVKISPDSKSTEKQGTVYRVDVEIDRSSIQAHGRTVQFKPGETGTAEVITRQRRLIDVFLDPFKKMQDTSL